MELTNAIRKSVRQLADARHRREAGLFTAEGTKCVTDTLPHFTPRLIAATRKWAEEHADLLRGHDVAIATRADLERMSSLTTPAPVIAVYEMPHHAMPSVEELATQLVIALDRIQDPGNLGTIIRVADWMGVRHILASRDTVDAFNPKVVQATMGSIARVAVHYCELADELPHLAERVPVYGTLLDHRAENIYTAALPQSAVLVMGNEGRGVSDDVRALLTNTLFIPPYPADAATAESLNVAVATSIALAMFRRQA